MIDRATLVREVADLQAIRRSVQEAHDAHILLAIGDAFESGSPFEEKAQKLGGLLRQLDESIKQLRSAVETVDQLTAHEAVVQDWLASKEAA